MIKSLYLICGALLTCVVSNSQSFKKLHQKAVLIDTHNDVLSSAVLDGKDISHRITEGHSDLDRWKEGGIDVQFFSVYTGPEPRNKEGCYTQTTEKELKNPPGIQEGF